MKGLLRIVIPAFMAAASFVGPQASADQPGAHPYYIHALSDLRAARGYLERQGDKDRREAKWDESHAIADIDAAIKKVKDAAIDDGKDLHDHPPVDAKEERRRRLGRALEALNAAHRDIDHEEDNNFAQDLKHRALKDIDSAIFRTKEGLCNEGDQSYCPH